MELIVGNPQVFHVAAFDEVGIPIEVPAFAVAATDAAHTSVTTAVGAWDATLGYPVTITPTGTLASPVTVVATGTSFRRVYVFGLIDVEQSLADYGSITDVQSYLGSLAKLTLTSNPSTNEVAQWLQQESLRVDLVLDVAGYVTPITGERVEDFISDIVDRLVVARVFERLAAAVNPSFLDYVAQWRVPAKSDLEEIRCGALPLPGAIRTSTGARGRSPSVITGPAAITYEHTQRFVDMRRDH